MERYKKEVPQKISSDLRVDSKNIILQPQSYGTFVVYNGGMPVHDKNGNIIEFSKEDFSKWVDDSMKADRYTKLESVNYESFRTRMDAELKGLQRTNVYALEQFDPHAGTPNYNRKIHSREAYENLVKQGLDKKPLSELFTLMK
jgi:hypothetical protein